jgi:hypothetical protein
MWWCVQDVTLVDWLTTMYPAWEKIEVWPPLPALDLSERMVRWRGDSEDLSHCLTQIGPHVELTRW